ncbi:cell wall protein RBR3-like [Nicotiana sylvestris]|uniref:cell wall protein RBR3-like n=1 Tax=Nicotiana sylvestris TaxID=4096 RepID=UPI00388C431D
MSKALREAMQLSKDLKMRCGLKVTLDHGKGIKEYTNQFAKLQIHPTDTDNTTSTSRTDSMIAQCMEADMEPLFLDDGHMADCLTTSLPVSSSNDPRLNDFNSTNPTTKPHMPIDTSKLTQTPSQMHALEASIPPSTVITTSHLSTTTACNRQMADRNLQSSLKFCPKYFGNPSTPQTVCMPIDSISIHLPIPTTPHSSSPSESLINQGDNHATNSTISQKEAKPNSNTQSSIPNSHEQPPSPTAQSTPLLNFSSTSPEPSTSFLAGDGPHGPCHLLQHDDQCPGDFPNNPKPSVSRTTSFQRNASCNELLCQPDMAQSNPSTSISQPQPHSDSGDAATMEHALSQPTTNITPPTSQPPLLYTRRIDHTEPHLHAMENPTPPQPNSTSGGPSISHARKYPSKQSSSNIKPGSRRGGLRPLPP